MQKVQAVLTQVLLFQSSLELQTTTEIQTCNFQRDEIFCNKSKDKLGYISCNFFYNCSPDSHSVLPVNLSSCVREPVVSGNQSETKEPKFRKSGNFRYINMTNVWNENWYTKQEN